MNERILRSCQLADRNMSSTIQSEPVIPPLAPGIKAADVIERMKDAVLVDTDVELATRLGVAKTTISSWRQRNVIPYEECARISLWGMVSIDWIITGEGEKSDYPRYAESPIDHELMEIVMFDFETNRAGEFVVDEWSRAESRGGWITTHYARFRRLLKGLMEDGRLTREEALASLRRSVTDFRKQGGPQ